ncbi:MAG: hypothetical protein QXL94_04700 [Candidatus Parvarchaeum sp.]
MKNDKEKKREEKGLDYVAAKVNKGQCRSALRIAWWIDKLVDKTACGGCKL